MKFSALLYKELRECLPWIVLTAFALLAIGGFLLRTSSQLYYGTYHWRYSHLSSGSVISPYDLIHYPVLNHVGPWLLLSSFIIGLVLGIRHFWVPNFTRTWPFLLHRSANRQSILAAKLIAASISIVVSLGFVWVVLYYYANQPHISILPLTLRNFITGWLFIILGIITYLGTTLSALSTARWYTTKIFGIIFVILVVLAACVGWSFFSVFILIVLCAVVLLTQIFDIFLKREF